MITNLKLEGLGLFALFTGLYFLNHESWGLFLALFFVPDLSFIAYAANTKIGGLIYNILHHQGLFAIVALIGYLVDNTLLEQIGIIFLAHSAFDRMLGYGLKYPDNFKHTHLGWIGSPKKE